MKTNHYYKDYELARKQAGTVELAAKAQQPTVEKQESNRVLRNETDRSTK